MSRPPIDLARKIKDVLLHTEPLPDEAKSPILHYRRTGTDIWNALGYVERALGGPGLYRAVGDRHLRQLYGMALVNLVESFERFLKEMAAECVECLADLVPDDRLDVFQIKGGSLAYHFRTGSLGASLCESCTWLNVQEVNKRFKDLLADPFKDGQFWLFPNQGQQPADQRWRCEPLGIAFQLRNTAVHNVGVITHSDAIKLRLLSRETVQAPRLLTPTRQDLMYLKRFLDETARVCNKRVGDRLAELLTLIHSDSPSLLVPAGLANRISTTFQFALPVAGVVGVIT
jgi:hypothetical protein